mgnify:CR=1 FL=1
MCLSGTLPPSFNKLARLNIRGTKITGTLPSITGGEDPWDIDIGGTAMMYVDIKRGGWSGNKERFGELKL